MGELPVGIVARLERAIDALELAAYRDGRTHASLPAGHSDRFESWDALTEARDNARLVIAEIRAAVSSPEDLAAVVTPVPAAASQSPPTVLS